MYSRTDFTITKLKSVRGNKQETHKSLEIVKQMNNSGNFFTWKLKFQLIS